MASHGLSFVGLDKKAYIFEATKNLHVQHEFTVGRVDEVCIWYNNNFLLTLFGLGGGGGKMAPMRVSAKYLKNGLADLHKTW